MALDFSGVSLEEEPPCSRNALEFYPASQEVLEICVIAVRIDAAPHENWLHDEPRDTRVLFDHNKLSRGEYSREVSRLLKRTVLIVFCDELPHAEVVGNFTEDQLDDRMVALQNFATQEVPGKLWSNEKWNWTISASYRTANNDYIATPHDQNIVPDDVGAILGPRLDGDGWREGGIILIESYKRPAEVIWGANSGLYEKLENFPTSVWAANSYTIIHEIIHTQQRQIWVGGPLAPFRTWLTEADADLGAFDHMRTMAAHPDTSEDQAKQLLDTIAAIKHGRALQTLLNFDERYCTALALDEHEGEPTIRKEWLETSVPRHRESWLAGQEIRARIYAHVRGIEIPKDTQTLHRSLIDWKTNMSEDQGLYNRLSRAFGADYDWGKISVEDKLKALTELMEKGELKSPNTARLGELMIDAANYFAPSILQHRQELQVPLRPNSRPSENRGIPEAWQLPTNIGAGAHQPALV